MHGRSTVTPTGPRRGGDGEHACSHDAGAPRWPRRGEALVALVALAGLWSVLFTPAALAGKPERLRLPPFESFVDPPGSRARRRSRRRASASPTPEATPP